jgi:hypothetical protein
MSVATEAIFRRYSTKFRGEIRMKTKVALFFIFAICAMLTLQANTAKCQSAAKDGLVSYWSFDNKTITGTTVKDVWGSNDGTLMNNPDVVEGEVNQALKFNGSNSYVSVEKYTGLDFTGLDFSIECWINIDDDDNSYIINLKDTTDNNPHIEFYTNYPSAGNLGAHILDTTGSGFRTTYTGSDVTDGKWHHVAMVYVDKSNVVYLYLDGKKVDTVPEGNGAINVLEGWNWISIGRSQVGEYTTGCIDELRIYNRALSDNEVLQNMTAKGLAVKPDGKLSFTWGKIKVLE